MALLVEWLDKCREALNRNVGCRQCGCCCEFFGHQLKASSRDLARWDEEGREDLLAMTSPHGRLWFDPQTGKRLDRCPFLRRNEKSEAFCAIQSTKPQICRDYPTLAHHHRCLSGMTVH